MCLRILVSSANKTLIYFALKGTSMLRSFSTVRLLVAHHAHIIKTVKIWQSLHVCLVFNQLFCSSMKKSNMRIRFRDSLTIKLKHKSQHSVSSWMLRPKVELHVPDEPLWFWKPSSMRHELRVVFLWPDIEVMLLCFFGNWRIVMSIEDGFWDVDVFPPSLSSVHECLSFIKSHEFFVRIPVMFATSYRSSMKTGNPQKRVS